MAHNLFAYVDEKDKQHVMFNPVIKLGLAASKQVEGCFTHEEPVTITRYDRIKVSYEELVDGKLVPRKGDFPRLGRAADPAHGRPRQGQVHLSAYEPKGHSPSARFLLRGLRCIPYCGAPARLLLQIGTFL